jgi:hypothetical protein
MIPAGPAWRVVVAPWDGGDPDWILVDRTFASWESARLFLLALVVRWAGDECDYCAGHAVEQVPSLVAAAPGSEWSGEVEGDNYLLMRVAGDVSEGGLTSTGYPGIIEV